MRTAERTPGIVARLCVAALLSACAAVGPDHAGARLDLPAAWGADMSEGLAPGPPDPHLLARWWDQIGDPGLTGLIGRIIAANTDLRSARARLREARARRAIARAGLLPSLGAFASASRTSGRGAQGSSALYAAGFDAAWELDLFGAVRRQAQAAQADLAASAASLDATQVSVVAEAALNYVEARALQARLRIARNNLASQAETVQLTEWRSQAGLVGSLDVEQARANLEQTRARIPELETRLAETQNRIAILAGRVPGTAMKGLRQPGAIPVPPRKVAVGIPADALRRRPDVRAAERTLAAQTARVGQAEAARYPSFALSGSIGLESLTVGGLGSAPPLRSFAASVASTLFDAGRLAQQVVAQDALREQARIAYEATVLGALGEAEDALVAFAASGERQAALRAAAEAARNAALLASQSYAGGLIDFQSVLDTQRSLLAIEDSLAQAQASLASAVVQLYKALGGGWDGAGADAPLKP